MTKQYRANRITTNTTTTPENVSCFVSQIVVACANAGTTWTLKIQDKGSPAKVWIPVFTMAVADPKIIKLDEPVFFLNGIDIITAGGTPGEVAVAINYSKGD